MKKAIWKYALEPGRNTIKMPQGAVILSCGQQRDQVMIWTLVNPQIPAEERTIYAIGTGHQVEDRDLGRFVGTTHILDGSIVVHVFEASKQGGAAC